MSTFAVTFVNIVGETVTRRVSASSEKKAIALVEQFGHTVKSCFKAS